MNEIAVRALSGIIYVILLLLAVLYTPLSFFGMLLILGSLTVYEYSNIKKTGFIPPLFFLAVTLCCGYFLKITPFQNALLAIAICLINLMQTTQLFRKKPQKEPALLHYTYLIGGFWFLWQIPSISNIYNSKLIAIIFMLIWCNDIFAYLTGKFFGKRKLFERISPKKTIEGFIGGVVATLLAALLIFWILKIHSSAFWVLLGFIISLLGTTGDLIQSKIKRDVNVKDSGVIMPGHGGIYDRVDSIVFAAPFVYIYLFLSHVS